MEYLSQKINQKLTNEILNLKKKMFQIYMRISGNVKPHSYPWISCDTFRWLADHKFDSIDSDVSLDYIKEGDIVYVSSLYIHDFFQKIHPGIKNPYVLITHNGIEGVNGQYLKYIDNKIIHWFGKNVLIKNPSITPIPIGLENLQKYGTGITSLYDKFSKSKIKKKNKILYHFKIATNKTERQAAMDYISKHPLAETYEYKLSPPLYLKKLRNYKFIISPPGAGEECHRSWEAMYINVIPIVKNSVSTDYFRKKGAPMWVVNDWNELDDFNQEKLNKKYQDIWNNSNKNVLYFDYWMKKISQYSNKTFLDLKAKFKA